MYTYLTTGVFGECETQANDYKEKCHKQFPHACLFKDPAPSENYQNNIGDGNDAAANTDDDSHIKPISVVDPKSNKPK